MVTITNPIGAAVRYIYGAYVSAVVRKSIRPLLSVDERLLRDIGLTRADVVDCLSSPLADDPSDLLIARRRERAATRVTYIEHPARWRGDASQSTTRIDRAAA